MSEADRFRIAIRQACEEGEPDSLYFEFKNQLWRARTEGAITLGDWSNLSSMLDIYWWEGRSEPDREAEGDC